MDLNDIRIRLYQAMVWLFKKSAFLRRLERRETVLWGDSSIRERRRGRSGYLTYATFGTATGTLYATFDVKVFSEHFARPLPRI